MKKKGNISIITTELERFRRPIQTINGISYFATLVDTRNQSSGEIANSWVVSSGDFSERFADEEIEGHRRFSEAPFQIDLAGTPRPGSTLSAEAYVRHAIDREPLPDVVKTFEATSMAIDSFVAFDHAFATQKDMSDFLACWVFATYATPIFETVGYIWPNGERGSGKTQCLKTVMALSFMGQTIASESSFASIRDEAALGGTIGFDDCENIRRMDPGKRELLLAGNTKGAGFMLKEPGKKEGTWLTRYIDAFAPRGFTSIGLPDDILASRTILIPLGRTADVEKTRRKPANLKDWQVSPSSIRDAIWLNIATDLAVIEAFKEQVNRDSDLAGRDFDIFQPTLTVACWLQNTKGIDGLYDRMCGVMESYHATKHKTLLPSYEHLLLQACLNLLKGESSKAKIATGSIVGEIAEICRAWDITDEELCRPDNQKAGMMMQRLGFRKASAHGAQRSWHLDRVTILDKARSAGITLEQTELAIPTEDRSTDDYFGKERIPVSTIDSGKQNAPW